MDPYIGDHKAYVWRWDCGWARGVKLSQDQAADYRLPNRTLRSDLGK